MTRPLGDFYAHEYGVTAAPEVRTIPLAQVRLSHPALLLASDGVWDIWDYDEVAAQLVPATGLGSLDAMRERAARFCEATRATGFKYFGERADNLTGVLVNLSEVCGR